MSIERQKTNARMSQIVKHNGTVYLAGQVPTDFSADIQEQARTTLGKIDGLLAEAGTSKENLISAVIYLKDIGSHFNLMNPVWEEWVPDGRAPVRACVEANMAHPDILIEISIIAAA